MPTFEDDKVSTSVNREFASYSFFRFVLYPKAISCYYYSLFLEAFDELEAAILSIAFEV